MIDAAHLFSAARRAQPRHFAAHSHHLWPDVTKAAHERAWRDAIELADNKWAEVFGVVLAEAQAHIAGRLALPDAATIAVATNTHELVTRLVSSLAQPTRILTTDAEFYSFRRQVRRWEEGGTAVVTEVAAEPFPTFPERFEAAAASGEFDLMYLSHVMFDSGYVVPDLAGLVAALPSDPELVVDGYHGFMALPTQLGAVAERIFYVSGGYKYAMAGEGACFMHCPPGRIMRPVDTGWFAGFESLEDEARGVGYGGGGDRFLGATLDPTPWYRFNAVQRMLNRHAISVAGIHGHVGELQSQFLESEGISGRLGELVPEPSSRERGHFLTFDGPEAARLAERLRAHDVVVDRRGHRIRIGFGCYHEPGDVDELVQILRRL